MKRQGAEAQRVRWIGLAGTLLWLLVAAALSGCSAVSSLSEFRAYWDPARWAKPPLETNSDAQQERLDLALPLSPGCNLGQSFVAQQANLSAIEVMLVLYGEGTDTGKIVAHLRHSPDTPDLAQSAVSLRGMKHNDLMRFSFPTQADSAGRSYYVCFEGGQQGRAGLWASSLNAYGEGSLYRDGQAVEGDLRFVTFCGYDLRAALGGLARALRGYWWPLLVTLALLFVPGCLIMAATRAFRSDDFPARAAGALGLSLCFWPLLMLWTTAVGIRLSPLSGGILLGALVIIALARLVRAARQKRLAFSAPDPYHLALAAILALTLATRYTEIRGLALPLWVDSVHQTLMTRLIADQGQIPSSYLPFLPVEAFTRHFGFNVLAAWLSWLGGLAAPQAVLILGQLLNALSILPVYALVARLCKSRLAGLVGALITGLISIMPAYYVSWGRYTQLAGMVVLPVALLALLDALECPPCDSGTSEELHSGTQRDASRTTLFGNLDSVTLRRFVPKSLVRDSERDASQRTLSMTVKAWALAAFACAGLLANHYRVLAFYACFALAYLLWETAAHRRDRRAIGAIWRDVCLVALGAIALVLPWLANLWQHTILPLATFAQRMKAESEYNAVPWDLVEAGHGRTLIELAKWALGWALLKTIGLAVWRSFRIKASGARQIALNLLRQLAQERAALLTLLWVTLVQLMVNPHLIGLQDIWVLNNSSAVIALYLPLALWIGYLFGHLDKASEVVQRFALPRALGVCAHILIALVVIFVGIRGARDLVSVINPVTILATRDDVQAMGWIRENTADDAKFLINTAHWQREIYRGTDGGWWIPLLADRQVTLPAIVYRAGAPAYIAAVNDFARWAAEAKNLDDASSLERLRRAGVTHAYIGAKGGQLTPQILLASPYFQPVYSNGAVWIFALTEGGS